MVSTEIDSVCLEKEDKTTGKEMRPTEPPRIRIRIRRPSIDVQHAKTPIDSPLLTRTHMDASYHHTVEPRHHLHRPTSHHHLMIHHHQPKHHLVLRSPRTSARPLSTYTILGSPLPRSTTSTTTSRPRSKSMGNYPSPPHHQSPLVPILGTATISPHPIQEEHRTAMQVELERAQRLPEPTTDTALRNKKATTEPTADLQAEVLLEEGRINGLMRHLDVLQEEKGRMMAELQQEEEFVRSNSKLYGND